jgi:adenylate kinase
MILVLLGPPGAGKGTQAKLLAAEYSIPHISTGDMFRDHKTRGTELGKTVQAIMDSGGLVTDDITNAMVKERLSRPDVAKGFILDGYPRTTAQAEYLEQLLRSTGGRIDRVLSYEVAEELVIERISGRRTPLVQREDDRPENVKKRMQEYALKTSPLKRFYEERKLVTEIEGVGTPQGILAATRAALEKR